MEERCGSAYAIVGKKQLWQEQRSELVPLNHVDVTQENNHLKEKQFMGNRIPRNGILGDQ